MGASIRLVLRCDEDGCVERLEHVLRVVGWQTDLLHRLLTLVNDCIEEGWGLKYGDPPRFFCHEHEKGHRQAFVDLYPALMALWRILH